jgi:hypothetical protein
VQIGWPKNKEVFERAYSVSANHHQSFPLRTYTVGAFRLVAIQTGSDVCAIIRFLPCLLFAREYNGLEMHEYNNTFELRHVLNARFQVSNTFLNPCFENESAIDMLVPVTRGHFNNPYLKALWVRYSKFASCKLPEPCMQFFGFGGIS